MVSSNRPPLSLEMSMIWALWARRSINAPVRVGSLKTSSHRSKERFEVTMIEPLSFLDEMRLKSVSQPILSIDTKPKTNSIQIGKGVVK